MAWKVIWFDRDDFYDFLGLPLNTPFAEVVISYSPALDQIAVEIDLDSEGVM